MGAAMRYQPQIGPLTISRQCGLLQGAKLLALIVGSHISSNLVDGKPLSIAGTNVKPLAVPEGIGATNSLGQGDLSATGIEAAGGSIFVDFWYGRLYGTAASNAYFFGDYDGANGQGIASRHSSIGGCWGYFDGSALNDSGETLPLDGTLQCFVTVRDTVSGTVKVYRNGALKITSSGAPVLLGALAVGSIGPNQWATFYSESSTVLAGRLRYKVWDAAAVKSFTNNPWQLFQAPDEEDFVAAGGGTDTPVNPAVGTLALTGYSPSIAQSVNQSIAPGTGSLAITGFAPSVTQGITTNIAPGAGIVALTGYAPVVAQSANSAVSPAAGTLTLNGYAPAIAQTANQALTPAVGALAVTGYAPTVSQAAASPSLTPDAGSFAITGYAPYVKQTAPVTKIGGDDVPRHEDEERLEIWEPRKPTPKRDDSLDKVVRDAYAKATGKPIAAAIAKPTPTVRAVDPDPFDYDEDDFEVLLLSY